MSVLSVFLKELAKTSGTETAHVPFDPAHFESYKIWPTPPRKCCGWSPAERIPIPVIALFEHVDVQLAIFVDGGRKAAVNARKVLGLDWL